MIKVLIERTIAEGLETNYEQTVVELLNHAEQSPGYLGGESYKNAKKPNHYVVVSSWESSNAWSLWLYSAERAKMQNQISVFLKEPEHFTILEPCRYQTASGWQSANS